jgi:hypothetical protein
MKVKEFKRREEEKERSVLIVAGSHSHQFS